MNTLYVLEPQLNIFFDVTYNFLAVSLFGFLDGPDVTIKAFFKKFNSMLNMLLNVTLYFIFLHFKVQMMNALTSHISYRLSFNKKMCLMSTQLH